ncbi:MAG: hypothetical protein EA377_10055 [Phycisphaerales bacterium]|nr:MAG: hypothetical protein EA377_10055 [Phycisphaerales bacterium]
MDRHAFNSLLRQPLRGECLAVLLLLAGLAVFSNGCAPDPPAAESNLRLTEDEATIRWTLDDRDRGPILEAMRSIEPDHQPTRRPGPAPHGVRWSDVPDAAHFAAIESEMVILKTEPGRYEAIDQVDEFVFTLRTIDDQPATLIVTRRPEPEIVEVHAVCGLFGDRDDRARELERAFDRKLRAFGRKRAWN